MKTIMLAVVVALTLPGAAMAKGKKSKPIVTTAPVVTVTPAPAPAPAPTSNFIQQQIDRALANSARPVGVTTYGAMAAAVAVGNAGGTTEQAVAAAEAASAGF